MGLRPELVAPPEIFYGDVGARRYTSSSRMIEIQASLSERAVELLNLPKDGVPKLLLDIGCGSGLSGEVLTENGHSWIGFDISPSMLDIALEREVQGDLLLSDMGQGLGLRPGVFDGAIGISSLQWLCNADKSSHNPYLRLAALFTSLYGCLKNGARAVFQLYTENIYQDELISKAAQKAGFGGLGLVDYPRSSLKKKKFLILDCGQGSVPPSCRYEIDESCIDGDNEDEVNKSVYISDRHRPRKRQKNNQSGNSREIIKMKKEKMRRRGNDVPPDTKYTGRKRRNHF